MIRNIKKILNFKKLIINFSFRSFANLFTKLLAIITLPIITRALGPAGYGDYNLVGIVIIYTSLPMTLLGLRSYGIREIAAKRKDKGYAATVLSLQLSITIIAVIISFFISSIIFKSHTLLLIAVVLGYIIVFSRALDLEFFYISQKNLIFPAIAKIIGQLFYVLGVILFIKKPNDFVMLVFIAALSPSIADIIQWWNYKSKYLDTRISFSFKSIPKVFKKTWQLGLSQNLEGLISTIPKLLLTILIGTYALGIFSAGYKIYGFIVMFYVTFFYALAPYLVQMNDLPEKVQKKYHLTILLTTFFFSSLTGIFLYYYGQPVVLLILGKDFGESISIFKLISLTLIPMSPIMLLLGNILMYSGKEKYYLIGLIIDAVVVLVSAPFLIKHYSVIGAVYSLSLSMVVTIIVLTYYYFKKNFS